jgi:hypothetical protein
MDLTQLPYCATTLSRRTNEDSSSRDYLLAMKSKRFVLEDQRLIQKSNDNLSFSEILLSFIECTEVGVLLDLGNLLLVGL